MGIWGSDELLAVALQEMREAAARISTALEDVETAIMIEPAPMRPLAIVVTMRRGGAELTLVYDSIFVAGFPKPSLAAEWCIGQMWVVFDHDARERARSHG